MNDGLDHLAMGDASHIFKTKSILIGQGNRWKTYLGLIIIKWTQGNTKLDSSAMRDASKWPALIIT